MLFLFKNLHGMLRAKILLPVRPTPAFSPSPALTAPARETALLMPTEQVPKVRIEIGWVDSRIKLSFLEICNVSCCSAQSLETRFYLRLTHPTTHLLQLSKPFSEIYCMQYTSESRTVRLSNGLSRTCFFPTFGWLD